MYSPNKTNEDSAENAGWTQSYLLELEDDRTSPLCHDSERYLKAVRTVLQEIEWQLKDIDTPDLLTGVPVDGPDLDTLIEWFEMEAQDLIARHRDRDGNVNPFLFEMTKDD